MKNSIIVWAAAGSVAALGLTGCATSESGTKADKRFARGEYETAIALYKAQAERGKNVPQSNFRVGEAYRLSNRIEQAELYYKMAVGAGLKNADAGFYYGLALKANGKYDEAAAQFDDYVKLGTNRALAARAEIEAKNARLSKELSAQTTRDEIQALDQVNSESADFSATMIPDTKEIVFASGRDGKKYLGNGEGFNDLYAIRFEDMDKMTGGTVRKLEPIFNTEGMHEASATYAPDGKMVVFARSNSGKKKGYLSVDLWASYFRSGAWTEPALININDRTNDDFSPVFSPDGETLYFASGRKGGEGGTDLYKATIAANGRFAPAENLGPEINTPGNESFPAIAPDGTLFFSSDGHPGIGKLDVFVVDKGKVRNLGAPMNSSGDDFAPYFTAQNVGVFSSNRAGGKGSDDLYRFRRNTTRLVNFFVDGTLLERDTKTGATKPVAAENVELFANGNRKVLEATTGPDGKFSFKLDSATTYALVADRPAYFTARTSVTTVGKMPAQDQLPELVNDIRLPVTLTLNKIVKNVAIVVENIFYDYNKADIRPDAATELDKLVETLNDNPKITIELSSHTDARGKDAYNASLSQRRAQSAVDYIISKGIAKERITAKGYGETQLVVRDARTEEQHQRNRRTEFKVTRIAE